MYQTSYFPQFLRQSSEDIYVHNSPNSNVYAIYKPKYEAHDNFDFHKAEEEIFTQDNNTQLGQQHSSVHEFSSVILVKEKCSDSQNNDRASISIHEEKVYSNYYEALPGCSQWPDV